MRILVSAATALLMMTMMTLAAFAADPVGSYTVKGTNPGDKGSYSGKVTVTKTGETYSVIWIVGSTKYVGTGIGDKNFIAVSYKSEEGTGLALYGADGGNWAGVWTYAGGRQVGSEIWSRN